MVEQRLGRVEPAGARDPSQSVGLPVALHVGDRDDLDATRGRSSRAGGRPGATLPSPMMAPAACYLKPVFERHHAQRFVQDGQPGRAACSSVMMSGGLMRIDGA